MNPDIFDWRLIEKHCKDIGLIQRDWMLVNIWYSGDKLIDLKFFPKWENSVKPSEHQIEIGDLESWIRDKKIQTILS